MNIEHLSEKFELNDLEKQIVSYIQEHLIELKSIGIRQMAKDNYTSTSTIYKLCKKFGFDGYSDMIYHLTSTKDNHTINYHEQYRSFYQQFQSLLQDHSKRIIVFGLGFSAPIAEYMQQRLTLLGYSTMCVVHMEMFSQHFLIIPFYCCILFRKTPRLNEMIETAYHNHVPIISFIGNPQSPIIQLSTLPIVIEQYDSFSHDLNRPNTFFGEAIIAFETLLF